MKNIAVIFGSRSCEHEVSIISALQCIKNVDKSKYNVIPIYVHTTGDWYVGESLLDIKTYVPFDTNAKGITKVELDMHPGSGALMYWEQSKSLFKSVQRKIYTRIDCVIPVFHGMNGEDGTMQGLFELANIPYASSNVVACSIGMDKAIMKSFFRGCSLPVVDDVVFTSDAWEIDSIACLLSIEEKLGYPVFVKPANLGSSIGVSKASKKEELIEAIQLALQFDRKILVEKAVENPIELNCSVLGDSRFAEASEIEMPVTGGDVLGFFEKYLSDGGSKGMASLRRILPAPIDDDTKFKIQNYALAAFKALDCKGVVRIDFMLDTKNEAMYITEINIIPGSLSFYLWKESGISYTELIDKLIDIAFHSFHQKLALNTTFTSGILQSNIHSKLGEKGIKK